MGVFLYGYGAPQVVAFPPSELVFLALFFILVGVVTSQSVMCVNACDCG